MEHRKFDRELQQARSSGSRINAQYNTAAPDSLPARIAHYQRRKMFRAFMAFAGPRPQDTILDVGVTSDRSYDHSNYFAPGIRTKQPSRLLGSTMRPFCSALYPGLRFIRADGRDLPFSDASFDYVHSSAVIEHVGDRRQQMRFLSEAWRVARKGIFVTTPNRWFPVEFHTVLPLLHWLPPRLYRSMLARLGREFFACEDNLNLLSRSDLAQLAADAGITSAKIGTVALGWMADKPAAQRAKIGDLGVRVPIRHIAALGTLAVLGFLWLGRGLPDTAWLASDSASYLDFSPVRPHGYPAFLAAYRRLFDDFAHLPAVQLGCYVAALWLLAIGIALRTQSFIAAATALVVVLCLTDTTGFPYVLSDSLYAALLVAAVACFLFYAETGRAGALVTASAAIGAALTFRTIGLALLPAFLIAAFIPSLMRRRHLLLTAALILLPIAGFYGAAAASQLADNGRFMLGSWGGMDILGKVPLLSRPVSPDLPYARLNGIVDAMQPARAQLARLDPLLEALAARQYYEHLRWDVVRPA